MWGLVLGVALAVPPSAEVVGDEVIGRVSVAASVDEVRARVTDPVWVAAIGDGSTETVVRGQDGECLLVESRTPTAFLKVQNTVRQCPTPEGARGALVSSNTFSSYTTEWRVVPEEGGSRIEYRTSLVTTLPLPRRIVYGSVAKEIETLMRDVHAHLDAR